LGGDVAAWVEVCGVGPCRLVMWGAGCGDYGVGAASLVGAGRGRWARCCWL
jgi:hypothetical protein